MSGNAKKLSIEEIKLRSNLLAKNKELLRLHRELVFTGALTEDEFWESRQV
jgi:transcription initiation factor TFIIH subunit 1